MRLFAKAVVGLAIIGLVPATAFAQASITGLVRDTSGAVLPGVTVEAASPALIEKVRSAVTDGTGQYRIVDLRPGTYTVTFALPGFGTVQREGVELTGSFTATINTELQVGALAETLTVTGESPIIDVQSAQRQAVLDSNILTGLPASRGLSGFMSLVPGVTVGNMNVTTAPHANWGGCCNFAIHGGRSSEGRMQVDGLDTGSTRTGLSGYIVDAGNAQEIVMTTSGGSAESEQGGPVVNVIPRTGGNTVHGSLFANGTGNALQGSNYTQALKDAGLTAPSELFKQWDINGSVGGPIRKDRLWYTAQVRTMMLDESVPGMYANLNAGNPAAWTYVPDLTRQARFISRRDSYSLRLTWQATARNKFSGFWDEQPFCMGSGWTEDGGGCRGPAPAGWIYGGTATTAPETGPYDAEPQRVYQTTWTSPISSRFLVEAGYGAYKVGWSDDMRPDNPTRNLIRVTEQAGSIPGLQYRSQNWADSKMGMNKVRASASYVTGAHNLKVGYQGAFLNDTLIAHTNDQRLAYRFNNGVPNQLTNTVVYQTKLRTRTAALYAQEQWTRGRLTLQGGVRYDRTWSFFPEQEVGPDRFLPVPIPIAKTIGVKGLNEITPRMGAAYDLFGNGRTSLKISAGKYLEQAGTTHITVASTNPAQRMATSTTRSWVDGNGNFIPDCDLLNGAAQDNRATGGDSCGAFANQNFGTANYQTGIDPALLEGWGTRAWDWGFGASVQHAVLPRLSVEVGYFRRWFGNFLTTDNRAVGASDFTQFGIAAPTDARLPNGGGYTVSGLYDVNPLLFGRVDNLTTAAERFAVQTESWQGVDININARLANGLTFQGGTSTGQTVRDSCALRAQLPEITPVNPYCSMATGFLTQIKGLALYTVPKVDVQVSGTLQSRPGIELAANYNVPNAIVQQTLGRPLAGGAPNVTVNLIAPGTLYGDRINQVDFRVGKILRFGGTRATVSLDMYNALNSDTVLTYNQTYNPANTTWLTPNSVLTARFVKFGVQFDF